MTEITANCTLNGHRLTGIPILNAGDWFGRTWLIEIGGSYSPLFLIVEADSVSDALDELAENEKFGHNIVVDSDDLGDYAEEDHFGPSGQVLDLDHLMIHGRESADTPFECLYYGNSLPEFGLLPDDYCHWEEAVNG